MFFSHANRLSKKGDIFIKITASEDTRVQVRSVLAGPNKSELYVGRILGERFFNEYNNLQNTKLPLEWKQGIASLDVLSGIIDVFPEDVNITCRVQIYFDSTSSIFFEPDKYVFLNKPIKKRVKISNGEIRHNFRIGDDLEYINNGKYSLVGNYGILHEYLIEFSEIGDYQLLFTANGGPASCVFMLDNKTYSAYSNNSKKIGIFKVKRPGLKKLTTFPLPGSNYPSTVTIVKERVYTK